VLQLNETKLAWDLTSAQLSFEVNHLGIWKSSENFSELYLTIVNWNKQLARFKQVIKNGIAMVDNNTINSTFDNILHNATVSLSEK
jgi:hypothetical protein